MKDIKSMLPEEIAADFAELGEPRYRAKQVYKWLTRGVGSFDEMSDIPKSLREKLKKQYTIYKPKVIKKQVSKLDGTIKYLWELYDGNAVETVVMSYKHGNTVCVSSQVGCRQGCAFCASTIGGLVRCLEPSEILDEVLFSQIDSGKQISNIVLMGIGEPLDNFDNVVRFLKLPHQRILEGSLALYPVPLPGLAAADLLPGADHHCAGPDLRPCDHLILCIKKQTEIFRLLFVSIGDGKATQSRCKSNAESHKKAAALV